MIQFSYQFAPPKNSNLLVYDTRFGNRFISVNWEKERGLFNFPSSTLFYGIEFSLFGSMFAWILTTIPNV